MLMRKGILYAYTDGSSQKKPRKGGMGIRYIYLDNQEKEIIIDCPADGYKGATNNQMELNACVEALKHLACLDPNIKYYSIEIRTDLKYVVNNLYYAKYIWPKQKWLNKYGKPILNIEIWKDLLRWIPKCKCKVDFVWVKGHKNDEHNNAADVMADISARGVQKPPLSVVTVRRKTSLQKTKIGSVQPQGQRLSIRIISSESLRRQNIIKYRYEVISRGSMYFENVDFAYSDLILRDGHSYIVSFNKEPKNPRILKLIKEVLS